MLIKFMYPVKGICSVEAPYSEPYRFQHQMKSYIIYAYIRNTIEQLQELNLLSVVDVDFLLSTDFIWKVLVATSVSCIPLFILKYIRRKFAPPSYSKLTWSTP